MWKKWNYITPPKEKEEASRRTPEKQDASISTSSVPRVVKETSPVEEVYVAIPPRLKALVMWGEPTVPRERLDEIRQLHIVCFPVKYSDSFYEKIANGTYPSRILYERLPSGRGRIVGFASSIIYQEPFKGYLATLGVRPEWRKRGIAKVLIRCVEAYLFKNYEIRYVELHVLHSNVAAIRLYESLEYTMIAFLAKHYTFEDPETGDRRHDAYLYRKYRDGILQQSKPDVENKNEGNSRLLDDRSNEKKESSANEDEQADNKYRTRIKDSCTGEDAFYPKLVE